VVVFPAVIVALLDYKPADSVLRRNADAAEQTHSAAVDPLTDLR
jgi:hypothetical protein